MLQLPSAKVFAWTDSKIVLSWLVGNPWWFNTYVANRVFQIIEHLHVPPGRWSHVSGAGNLADHASQGVYPADLVNHSLWWNGPQWLKLDPSQWPRQPSIPTDEPPVPQEKWEVSLHSLTIATTPVISLTHYSSFNSLVWVTAWILRFVHNVKVKRKDQLLSDSSSLTVAEVQAAEVYWLSIVQDCYFSQKIRILQNGELNYSSSLLTLHPFRLDCYEWVVESLMPEV